MASRTKLKAEVVDGLIEKYLEFLSGKDNKPTVADLLRLIELKKELRDEGPKEITVQWVEPRD